MTDKLKELFIVQYHLDTKRVRIEDADEMLKLNIRSVLENINIFYVVVGIASSREDADVIASEFGEQLQKANLLP